MSHPSLQSLPKHFTPHEIQEHVMGMMNLNEPTVYHDEGSLAMWLATPDFEFFFEDNFVFQEVLIEIADATDPSEDVLTITIPAGREPTVTFSPRVVMVDFLKENSYASD